MTLTLHATCVAIDGAGVLLTGPSGAGKSDLALRLIDRGAALVSDDYTFLTAANGQILATAPHAIRGRIEVREIGILPIASNGPVPVALVVDLTAPGDRLPESQTREIAGIALPLVMLTPRPASAPIKVELALRRALEER